VLVNIQYHSIFCLNTTSVRQFLGYVFWFLQNHLQANVNCMEVSSVCAYITGSHSAVFLNCRAAARYRALASIIPGRKRPKETTTCYKISLVQLITNLNVILYLSACHTVYISVLILFMIMP
jgi:hypothetical protein